MTLNLVPNSALASIGKSYWVEPGACAPTISSWSRAREALHRRRVPHVGDLGLAIGAAEPDQLVRIEAHGGGLEQRRGRHAVERGADRGAVNGPAMNSWLVIVGLPGARLVLHDHGRLARNVLGQEAQRPRRSRSDPVAAMIRADSARTRRRPRRGRAARVGRQEGAGFSWMSLVLAAAEEPILCAFRRHDDAICPTRPGEIRAATAGITRSERCGQAGENRRDAR